MSSTACAVRIIIPYISNFDSETNLYRRKFRCDRVTFESEAWIITFFFHPFLTILLWPNRDRHRRSPSSFYIITETMYRFHDCVLVLLPYGRVFCAVLDTVRDTGGSPHSQCTATNLNRSPTNRNVYYRSSAGRIHIANKNYSKEYIYMYILNMNLKQENFAITSSWLS